MKLVYFDFMLNKILGKRLAFITAHPDDESVLATGLILLNKQAKGENSLFCASLGGKGSGYLKNSAHKLKIKDFRKKELSDAMKYLGIKKFQVENFPDSKIKEHKINLKKKIFEFLSKTKPEVLVSFSKDGFTGHADHIIVGEVAKEFAKAMKIKFVEFSRPPLTHFPDLHQHLIKKRKNGSYGKFILKDYKSVFCVSVESKKKLRALKIYKTQFLGINPHNIFPKHIAEHVLKNEYFRVVK